METISVVLAVFNEEENIGSCLDSVVSFADEIVVVDGSSSDKTVEIAKKYKAKVFVVENKPNFHINKQLAIDKATKNWILQLDADEKVSSELAHEIKNILHDKSNRRDGYWMPRKNWFLGRFLMKGGQYPDYTLRLYRNGKGKLPQKNVHEQAVVDGEVGYLNNALLHYPYKDFSAYLLKWKRYNLLFAQDLKSDLNKRNLFIQFIQVINYLFVKPSYWFLLTYIRHKGFLDGWAGFVFSFFSALRFPYSYILYLRNL